MAAGDTTVGSTPRTALWEKSLAGKNESLRPEERSTIQPFTEMIPVGRVESASDEAVIVVLAGAVAMTGGKVYATGDWFAVRVKDSSLPELKEDLRAELEHASKRFWRSWLRRI